MSKEPLTGLDVWALDGLRRAASITLSLCVLACACGTGSARGFVTTPAANPAQQPPSNQETYKGINIFDTASPYTRDVSNASVDPNSADVIGNQGGNAFSPNGGFIAGVPIETFNIATNATPTFTPNCQGGGWCPPIAGPVPWATTFAWETCCGDSHAFVVNAASHFDWEMYGFTFTGPSGPMSAYAGKRWNLAASLQSQYMTQFSGPNAAGLPMIAGAYISDRDCCATAANYATFINHATAFGYPTNTLGAHTANWGYLRPASGAVAGVGTCSASCAASSLYYGDRLRLKSSFTLPCTAAGTCPQASSIVAALKRYGMFYEDQSATQFFILFAANEGTVSSSNWSMTDLGHLGAMNIADFEIVQRGDLLCYSGHVPC